MWKFGIKEGWLQILSVTGENFRKKKKPTSILILVMSIRGITLCLITMIFCMFLEAASVLPSERRKVPK
jgi:hypothetical protein